MDVSGILIVNKPAGVSSHRIVNIVRRIYGIKTVGHAGTLDPMATGVLPVLIGRAVKACEYMQDHDKSYIAGVKLGLTTDSGDTTGTVLNKFEGALPDFKTFAQAAESLVGEQMQVPPMYSALKVGGVKLVDLARKGIEVERKARKVNIYSVKPFEKDGTFYIDVDCSKGTYIRTLCENIGEKLGCGACMCALNRTRVDEYKIEDAYSTEQLEAMSENELLAALIPVETVFIQYPKIILPDFYAKLFKNGCEIYCKKIKKQEIALNEEGILVRVYDKNGFIAFAETAMFDNGLAVRAKKMFFN